MSYEVGFKSSALREVRKLDEVTRKAIISIIISILKQERSPIA